MATGDSDTHTVEEMKAIIDGMSREDLYRRWRFGVLGDPLLQGEVGDYFAQKLKERGILCSVAWLG